MIDCEGEEIGLNDLKISAVAYYGPGGTGDGVTQKMEEALNSMFYDQPEDRFGYLANYFEQFSLQPVITKLFGTQVLDGCAQPAIQTQVYCNVKGKHKLIATYVGSCSSSAKPDDKDESVADNEKCIQTAVCLIRGTISEEFCGINPINQESLDISLIDLFSRLSACENTQKPAEDAEKKPVVENPPSPGTESPSKKMTKNSAKESKGKGAKVVVPVVPDEPPEALVCGCDAASVVSAAVCKSAALISGCQLFEHITQSFNPDKCEQGFKLPLPMVTILSCGRGSPGKLRCVKEFMVIPSWDMPLCEALDYMNKIYSHCYRVLQAKGPAVFRMTNDIGALCPLFDKPEQGLDLLTEAITQLGLKPGVDFHLALNCAAQEMFDFEKGKYETSVGQLKSGEELMKYWVDLLTRYPSVIAVSDVLRKQDHELWNQLAETLSPRCYIVGDFVYHRPGRLRYETLPADFRTSAVVLCLQQLTTVTDVVCCAKRMQAEACNEVIIGCRAVETSEAFAVDLAIGCGAKFLKIGGLHRCERVNKLNRLLEVESYLTSENKLAYWGEHVFTPIKIAPDVEPDTQDGSKSPLQASPTSPDAKGGSRSVSASPNTRKQTPLQPPAKDGASSSPAAKK